MILNSPTTQDSATKYFNVTVIIVTFFAPRVFLFSIPIIKVTIQINIHMYTWSSCSELQ